MRRRTRIRLFPLSLALVFGGSLWLMVGMGVLEAGEDETKEAGLRALQKDMIAARAAGDTARAVAADGEFHQRLWEASGLRQVRQLLQNVWDRGEYYRVIMHARRGGFAAESLAEHEEILRALEAADWARAAHAVDTHRVRAMERLAVTS